MHEGSVGEAHSLFWAAVERTLRHVLVAGVCLVPLVALAGAFLLALGYDESWYLTDVRAWVERGVYGGDEVGAAWTSGGAYTAVVAILSSLSGGELWVVRLVSVVSTAVLLILVFRWGITLHGGRVEGALMAVWVVALPGTLTFAASAYGTLIAFTLTVGSIFAWSQLGAGTAGRRVSVGLLIGLAVATRWNCLFVLPALAGAALTGAGDRRQEVVDGFVAAVIGAVFAGALVFLLVAISEVGLDVYSANVLATGVGNELLDYPRHLNKWSLSQDFFPFPLMVVATVFWLWGTRRLGPDRARGLDLLPWFGWLLWVAWLLMPEVGHLRYVWPALAAFALMLGYGLGALHRYGRERDDPRLRALALVVGVACLATGYASTLRAYVHGSNDVLSWEWSGYSPRVLPYLRFGHLAAQKSTAEELATRLARGDRAMAVGESLQLAYLSRRQVHTVAWFVRSGHWSDPSRLPRLIVVTPDIGGFHTLGPEALAWFGANTKLLSSYGSFAIYEVIGEYPSDPNLFTTYPPPVPPPLVPHPGLRWIEPLRLPEATPGAAGAP